MNLQNSRSRPKFVHTRRQLLGTGVGLIFGLSTVDAVKSLAQSRQGQVTLTVSPSSIRIEAISGASHEEEITVRNDGDVAFGVRAVVGPFAGASEGVSAIPWITIEPDVVQLKPGDEGTFTVNMAVPNDAATGSYFALVTFTTERDAAEGENTVGVAGAVAVPIVFTVQGDEELVRSAQVERMMPFLEPDGRIGFRAEIHNDGNVHTRVPGNVEVLGPDGSSLAALEFPDTTLLPGQTQIVRATGTLPLPADTEYTARATFTYGPEDDQKEVTSETTFTFGDVPPASVQMAMCENLDRGPTLTMQLANAAEIGQVPGVTLRLQQAGSTSVLTATDLPRDIALWPGDELDVVMDLPTRLETGQYVLIAEVSVGGGEPVPTEFPFEIGGNSPDTIPLCALLTPSTPSA